MSVSGSISTVGATKVDRYAYLNHLLNQGAVLNKAALRPEIATLLQELRDRATAQLREQALPSTRDEEWRFTDLSPLLSLQFQPSPAVSVADIAAFELLETTGSRLVFINGHYAPHLSSTEQLPAGVLVSNLSQITVDGSQFPWAGNGLSSYLGRQPGSEEVFTALNTAGLTDAAVVWVPQQQQLETPIHLLFLSVGQTSPTLHQPRCLVVAETGSQVTLVETYAAIESGVYLNNAVTEIWLGENAVVRHTRVQQDSLDAFHIGKTVVSQARDSRYTGDAISLGAQVSRHHLDVFQMGEQTETTLNGLTAIRGEQVSDTHSTIAYTKPHGRSRQLHKCIVDGEARAVFNGKVFVPKPAQLTDAGQLNRNLLLSPRARVDTKPQLEITADNVKCSHGATVSQLDAEEVFYLQSRGLDQASAQKLLIDAFALEILQQISVASLRQQLAATVINQPAGKTPTHHSR